ncbi:uncharacterized protein RSE6_04173 [Rhynchosporium secalis]|uniref:Ima1 N-terminal domain-containing protein n=1 Tax=Rhynchosporium secalis TaxID=38038 RepID=A0A1E1M4L0_RHYSE|nr:uncharacterized protein RSE6_04173 [Rhynchosporium secalis]
MAPIRGRSKYLTCFYCNTRSSIRYDGVRQWECTYCDAQNYLDENGEITDPPVATDLAAPADLKYSTRPVSPENLDNDVFCATCLKNQHIVATAIAEYPFDTDTCRPAYIQDEREFNSYKQGLENRFPQVCAHCEPKVLAQMRQAGKTAKTDHLRRMMFKSREARSAPLQESSWFGILLSITRILWYLSIAGQILWDVSFILDILVTEAIVNLQLSSSLERILPFLDSFTSICTSDSWIRYSLKCGFESIWWNPEFDPATKAFKKRLKGFKSWYIHQLALIILRTMFYYTTRNGVAPGTSELTTFVAHGASLILVFYLAISAHSAIKIDRSPLWADTPQKLSKIAPSTSTGSPAQRGIESLGDLLDEIAREPRSSDLNPSPPSSPLTITQIRTPARPPIYNPQRHNSQVNMSYAEDEMEWLPTVPQTSSFRVFTPPSRPQTAQKFGESPIGDKSSPFWFKVPSAPITPAHRQYNPPNKPTFTSQAVKENFFSKPAAQFSVDPGRRGMEMKQQSLFIPEKQNPDGDLLSGLLGGISIAEHVDEGPRRKDIKGRIGIAMLGVVAVGLASWCVYQF